MHEWGKKDFSCMRLEIRHVRDKQIHDERRNRGDSRDSCKIERHRKEGRSEVVRGFNKERFAQQEVR